MVEFTTDSTASAADIKRMRDVMIALNGSKLGSPARRVATNCVPSAVVKTAIGCRTPMSKPSTATPNTSSVDNTATW